jgi:16S rRNA (cytosine967-C5)-methyltransferase
VKSNSVSPARLAAFEILARVEDGAYASVLLATRHDELSPADRALTNELVLGVLRQQLFLDTLIEHFANRKITTLDSAVILALRLGLYQLRFLSRIPASAAVNESVNLVRRARLRSAEDFANAVLRRAAREPEFDPLAEISDPLERLAIETSHPRWLIERWVRHLGLDFTTEFVRANNLHPPLAFRVVTNQANELELVERLRASGASVEASQVSKGGWLLSGATSLLMELVREGKAYIQDEASQLVGNIVQPGAGQRILDLCAAPGSKTSHLADLTDDRALIVACDLRQARLSTVIQTAKVQGFTSINCLQLDGLNLLPFSDDAFEAVLVDAPCSGTGTLRRNPEIRWRISAADLEDLSSRQKRLLANASRVVKPGGTLVYSTCSVEPEENEEVVADFLADHEAFEQVVPMVNEGVSERLITPEKAVRTWPHRDGADGFFVAALRRRDG